MTVYTIQTTIDRSNRSIVLNNLPWIWYEHYLYKRPFLSRGRCVLMSCHRPAQQLRRLSYTYKEREGIACFCFVGYSAWCETGIIKQWIIITPGSNIYCTTVIRRIMNEWRTYFVLVCVRHIFGTFFHFGKSKRHGIVVWACLKKWKGSTFFCDFRRISPNFSAMMRHNIYSHTLLRSCVFFLVQSKTSARNIWMNEEGQWGWSIIYLRVSEWVINVLLCEGMTSCRLK